MREPPEPDAIARQSALFIPHGGGPCFFMPDPAGRWTAMADFLRSLPDRLPAPPRAILIVTGHWETRGFALTAGAAATLIYDYYGFPPDTYQISYPAPGAPAVAARASTLLGDAGLDVRLDADHGFDHGVFIPLKVAFPEADVPVVAMSIDASLDPALHLAAGRALAPLRDEGVIIIGSGMSFHNSAVMAIRRQRRRLAPLPLGLPTRSSRPHQNGMRGFPVGPTHPPGAFPTRARSICCR